MVVSARATRAWLASAALIACSGGKPRPDDARPAPAKLDASAAASDSAPAVATDAAPAAAAATTGDLQVRVEWRDVPVAMRASPGPTACGTPRAPVVAPTTTWGIPDVVVLVEGAAASAAPARIVLADCALTPRAVAAPTAVIASAMPRPTRLALAKRGTVASLDALTPGTARTLRLPIAGHAVELALDDGGVYELATDGKTPESAWLVAAPAAVTDAAGHVLVRDLAPGPHAVTAWLPPRAGAPGKLARGTATVEAGELATLTLELAR